MYFAAAYVEENGFVELRCLALATGTEACKYHISIIAHIFVAYRG